MASRKRIMRGLRDIRTHSGGSDAAAVPFRAYMKISCLEMEKLRRGKERDSARRLIESIDVRFKEIETEKVWLFRAVRDQEGDGAEAPVDAAPSEHRGAGGFKVKY